MRKFVLTIMVLLIGILGMSFVQTPVKQSNMKESKDDSMSYFYKLMELEASGAYNDILLGMKHKPDRLAPAIIRQLVERFEPQKLSFYQGVDNKDGLITFWWYFGEFAVKGESRTFHDDLDIFMSEDDFIKEDTSENGRILYHKETDLLMYQFSVDKFENYTGGPLSGGSLYFGITFHSYLPEPSIGDILKLYPAINPYTIPLKVEKCLNKEIFQSISYGGTWENYYSWDTDVKCGDESLAESLSRELTNLVMAAGYKFKEENGDTRTFSFQESGPPSFIYLRKDDSNITGFRFQPNS